MVALRGLLFRTLLLRISRRAHAQDLFLKRAGREFLDRRGTLGEDGGALGADIGETALNQDPFAPSLPPRRRRGKPVCNVVHGRGMTRQDGHVAFGGAAVPRPLTSPE